MISTHIKNAFTQLINGPTGQLEIAIDEPLEQVRSAWGVICHPHPLYGGTMHNKVVTTLARAFQHLGVTTIRFNFRGVGKSEGEYGQGQGELEDLMAVIEWMQSQRVKNEIWLGGFSFGAYIAAKAATQIPIDKLVTIAPPVQNFPMQNLSPIFCPWVLVQGERDDIVPAKAVLEWAEKLIPTPTILRFPSAGHFFHGQLTELRMEIMQALQE